MVKEADKTKPVLKITTARKKLKARVRRKKVRKFRIRYKYTGNGKLTFRKVKGRKTIKGTRKGIVKVKKGLKKGVYTIRVKVTAAATSTYKAATATKTIKISIR